MTDSLMLQMLLASPVNVAVHVTLLWTRCVMFLGIAQVFGLVGMPRSLRLVVAFVLAVFLGPIGFVEQAPAEESTSQYMLAVLVMKEGLLGFALGALVAVPIWVAEGVGALFDNQRGAMTGQTFNPMLTSPSPTALLLQYAAVITVLAHGGLSWICELLALVAGAWPAERLLPPGGLQSNEAISAIFSTMARGMLLYFAPLLATMFLVEVAIALMSVYAPQLQAFTLAMPAKTLVGLFMLILVLGAFLDAWWNDTSSYLLTLLADARGMSNGR